MLYYIGGDNEYQGCTYAIQLPILFVCRHLAGSKKIIFIQMSWRRRMKRRIRYIEVRYVEVLFHTFYCNFGRDVKSRSLYRGLR